MSVSVADRNRVIRVAEGRLRNCNRCVQDPFDLFSLDRFGGRRQATDSRRPQCRARHRAKYAGKDQVNPGIVILSGELKLRYMGWTVAADLILKGMNAALEAKTLTYDFERPMKAEGVARVWLLKSSEFGDVVVKVMG